MRVLGAVGAKDAEAVPKLLVGESRNVEEGDGAIKGSTDWVPLREGGGGGWHWESWTWFWERSQFGRKGGGQQHRLWRYSELMRAHIHKQTGMARKGSADAIYLCM